MAHLRMRSDRVGYPRRVSLKFVSHEDNILLCFKRLSFEYYYQ